MGRGTRFKHGLGGTVGNQHTKEQLDALVTGVASGDTTYDGLKIAAGYSTITGSRDIDTGLSTVVAGSANVSDYKRKSLAAGTTGPAFAQCRVSKLGSTQVPGTKGAGYMKVIVSYRTASVEATAAAVVDWFAVGTM
jgi:hypothetical protein